MGVEAPKAPGIAAVPAYERHVFAPAGMKLATFRQPLPANLKPYMAEGYQPGSDKPYGYEFVGVAPAGSLAASG